MLEGNSLQKCFSDLDDPRSKTHSSRHLLSDIMLLTILAVLCGADSWSAVERFGESKYEWLKDILVLPNGIPSHDTIGDLFSRLNPKQLQSCFLKWVNKVFDFSGGEIIAVDGKTLCHSYDTASDKPAIHMVSAWACKNNLVLGQVKTKEKSNEITAIPELLKSLNLRGNIVTIDAMGCQKKIAKQIIDQEGDYVLNLKANQPKLNTNVSTFFDKSFDNEDVKNDMFDKYEVTNDNHGRIESRRYSVTDKLDWLPQLKDWSGLKSVGMVEYEKIEKTTGEIIIERRYFISSLSANAKKFAEAIRMHWGIENGLHWCLDVGFNEDDCRVRKDYSSENFAVIRHIALNLLKQEKTAKVGIKIKRQMAGWDNSYLAKILDSSKKSD
jgi:predicted transposase YbfD/YdcC